MKKTLILLCIPASLLKAQPNLTSAHEATIGNSFTYIYVDPATVIPGPGGVSQSWNFSGAVPIGATKTDDWVSVASTPFAASFAGSNIVQKATDTSGFSVYLYYHATPSTMELNGIAFDAGGTNAVMSYSNPEIVRQYPATYNTTFTDGYAGLQTLSIGPLTTNTYRNGSYFFLADAYGTLTTPAGAFPNTLRIRIRQVFTDSIVYVGLPIPPEIHQNFSTTYFWASATPGSKFYQFYIGYDTSIVMGNTTVVHSASYQGTATSVSENMPYEAGATKAWPNPASNLFSVSLEQSVEGPASLRVYDLQGKEVMKLSGSMMTARRFEWSFSVSGLPAGLYHVQVTCGGKQWKTNMIKY